MEWITQYKENHTVAKRKAHNQRARAETLDRLPVIIDRADDGTPTLKRNKFLIPKDMTLGKSTLLTMG